MSKPQHLPRCFNLYAPASASLTGQGGSKQRTTNSSELLSGADVPKVSQAPCCVEVRVALQMAGAE